MGRPLALLCEDNFQGHRWNYVELLAAEAVRLGVDVRIVTTAAGMAELKDIAPESAPAPVDILADSMLGSISAHATALGADRVVIPDADRYALRLAQPGLWKASSELRLLVMREHAQPRTSHLATGAIEITRRCLFRLAQRQPRVRLFYLASALSEPDATHVPDPVTLAPDTNPPVKLGEERFWFAVLGALDARKNVPVVLEALDRLDPDQVGLVLAGRQAPEVASEVRGHHSKAPVRILDARLTDGELDSLVSIVDCLVLLYSNAAPSGMVAKAAAAGTRVILPDAPAYAADRDRLGAGATLCQIEPESAAAAMTAMMTSPRPRPLPLSADKFVRQLML